MKLQIKTTFDFGKLERKIPDILNDLVDESKMVYAEMSAKNISDGLRPLKKASIEARKKGHYWGGKKVTPTTSTKPLVYTGELFKSIKIVDKGVEMWDYGLHHHKGFEIPMKRAGVTFNQKVAPRKFLALKLDGKSIKGTKYGKSQQQFIDKMYKKIGKALKK